MTDGMPKIDFNVNKENLYREEVFNDFRTASIRRLVPVNTDGSDDTSRGCRFVGNAHIMTPQGPVPIQAALEAETLEEAIEKFPATMEETMKKMMEEAMKMQQQQQQQEESRIIVPGR